MLPEKTRERARQRAGELGISFAELVRRALEAMLSRKPDADDPLLADREVYHGDAPPDLAAEHDWYLYGRDGNAD